jgi:hypothetical protein
MSVKCSHCGYDANRDRARYCRQCGNRLSPTAVPFQSQPSSHSLIPAGQRAGQPQPQVPSQVGPTQPLGSPPWVRALTLLGLARPTGPLVTGTVTVSRERRDRPPRDWYKALFISSLVLMLSPAIVVGAVLLCLVPVLAIAVSIFLTLFRQPSGSDEVPIYELIVDDVISGRVVNVEMIGQRGGGSIEVGDEVEVYGQWANATVQDNLRAWEIRITSRYTPSRGGRVPSGSVVTAKRPFPSAVAIGTFLVALAGVVWACAALSG